MDRVCPRVKVFSGFLSCREVFCTLGSVYTHLQPGDSGTVKEEQRVDVSVLWKEMREEGRWRRKQGKDLELGFPESRWEKVRSS